MKWLRTQRWGREQVPQLDPLRQVGRPFCLDAGVERLARAGDDREGPFAAERDAGVDHRPRMLRFAKFIAALDIIWHMYNI
jgi:hypothetical protein